MTYNTGENDKTAKRIVLEQIADYHTVGELKDVEVGDEISGFKVVEVNDMACEHKEFSWHINSSAHSSTPPDLVGRCRLCGYEKTIEGGKLEDLAEE